MSALLNIKWQNMAFPFVGLLAFLFFWQIAASQVTTTLGSLPGPVATAQQFMGLVDEHEAEQDKKTAFYQRQEQRNADKLKADPDFKVTVRPYTGRPTFFDQITTSLITVATGFLVASLIAIPMGIILGLNQWMYQALNPVIQILKPISPLAWLPLVTMVVSAVYSSDNPLVAKSFINSAFTVTLCSLWPTLLNTTVGVANIDPDLKKRQPCIETRPADACAQNCAAIGDTDDFHRLAPVAGRGVDGADCSRNAGAESGLRQIRVG